MKNKPSFHVTAFLLISLLTTIFLAGCGTSGSPPANNYGTLNIQIANLDASATSQLQIRVLGPNDFYKKLNAPSVLSSLKPGIYKVSFNGIPVGDKLYTPQAFEVLAEVAAGQTTTVSMPYITQEGKFKATPAPSTKELREEDVLRVSENAILLRSSLSVVPGDILVFTGSPLVAPDGFLVKVLSVRSSAEGIEVETEAAGVEEAYQELHVELSKPVSAYEVAAAAAVYQNKQFNLDRVRELFTQDTSSKQPAKQTTVERLPIARPGVTEQFLGVAPLGEYGGGFETSVGVKGCMKYPTSAPVTLKGCLGFQTSFGIDLLLDVSWLKLNELKMVSTFENEGSISVSLVDNSDDGNDSGDAGNDGNRKVVFGLPLGVWVIGPVTFNPELYGVVSYNAASIQGGKKLSASIKLAELTIGSGTEVGFSYKPSASSPFQPINKKTPLTANLSIPISSGPGLYDPISARLQADLQAGVGIRAKIYNFVGPYAEVLIGPSAMMDLNCSEDPWWDYSLNFDANIGVQAEFMKFVDLDFSSRVHLYEKPLGTAEPVLAIDPTQLVVSPVGEAELSVVPSTLSPFCATENFSFSLEQDGATPAYFHIDPGQVQVNRAGEPVNLALAAAAEAEPGTTNLTLHVDTGRTGRSFPLEVTVVAEPSFTLSLNPTTLTVTQGQSAQTTLTLTPQDGFSGEVSLSLLQQDGSAAPSGLTLSPTQVSVSGADPVTQALTLTAASDLAAGTYYLRLRGSAGTLEQTADFTLTVEEGASGGSDASQWTVRSAPLYDVTYGNGTFVAVGNSGAILTSPDGVSWTVRHPGIGDHLRGVTYGNGTFVVVGNSGAILTSPDGVSWTVQGSGTWNVLYAVTYGNGTFVAVGEGGTLLTSPDGVNWTAQDSGTGNDLTGVTYGGGTFVAVGRYGTLLTSP